MGGCVQASPEWQKALALYRLRGDSHPHHLFIHPLTDIYHLMGSQIFTICVPKMVLVLMEKQLNYDECLKRSSSGG